MSRPLHRLRLQSFSDIAVIVLGCIAVASLSGCQGSARGLASGESVDATTYTVTGSVQGGQQPVSGALIRLYAVGTSGDGSAATSLMSSTVKTDSSGTFVLTGAYSCPTPSTQVYLLATGGDPGLGANNAANALMSALGACGSLTSSTFISVNELTTVASVAALVPYMQSMTSVGSTTGNAPQLSAAMNVVNQYVDTARGTVPGPMLPNGYYASTLELTSLANAVATCVNSRGGVAGDSSACGKLFTYATHSGSVVPTDTIGALIDILSYPTNNVTSIFNLIDAQPPFAPALTQSPSSWALPILSASNGTVQLQNATYAVTEGAASIALTFIRSSASGTASVRFGTIDGTAVAGSDYQAASGLVTWASGDSSAKTFSVPLYDPGVTTGTRSFTVALNSPAGVALGTNASATISIREADAPLTIATTSLGSANQYGAYTANLAGTGGVGALTWSIASGSSLPAGLTLSSAGVLSGTPTVSGNVGFTVQLNDQATPTPQIRQQALSLSIVSLATQVANLPADTAPNAIKKAVLTWGVNGAASLAANGDTTGSANLIADVVGELSIAFTVPATLPSQYFPTIPAIATNPSVIAANKTIGTNLSNDAKTPPVWDDPAYTTVSAGAALQDAEDMLTALVTPGQSYYLNPALISSMLSRMESATCGAANSYPGDFASAPEIAYFYLMLSQGWPQLMLPSRQAVWKQIIANNTAVMVANNGAYFTNYASNISNWWINADVRIMTSIVYGDLVGGTTAQHTAIVQGALAEMQAVLLPDGGTNYTDTQNETMTYHDIYTTELARYTRVTGDGLGAQLAAGTRYYTPLSVLPPAVGEYITAVSWKKYWNTNSENNGMEVVVGLTGDQSSQAQLQSVGYPDSYISASYYRPDVTAVTLPANWISYDRNAQGPRGIQGNFAYMGTTRATPYSTRGKATFVGAVNLNTTASGGGWALNSAVESAGTIVLKATGAELVGASNSGAVANLVNEAQSEHNASTTTGSYGAVTTVHTLSGYKQTATSWVETEGWILLPTRVIGLVSIKNTASEKAFELDGGFKLVSGRAAWGTQKTVAQLGSNLWSYGSTTLQVYAHDYASTRTELTGTWEDTANKAAWILLTDANNSTSAAYTYLAGTSHYYIADFRPSANAAAGSVQKLSLAAGLAGFSFSDGGVTYTLIQNTTAGPIAYTTPGGASVVPSGAQYRPSWIDPTGTTAVAPTTYAGAIPAYAHIVITQ